MRVHDRRGPNKTILSFTCTGPGCQYCAEADADLALLELANDRGKFAIQLNYQDIKYQEALERGIDGQWFTLVDVSIIAETAAPVLMRVFRLTKIGWLRRHALAVAKNEGRPA